MLTTIIILSCVFCICVTLIILASKEIIYLPDIAVVLMGVLIVLSFMFITVVPCGIYDHVDVKEITHDANIVKGKTSIVVEIIYPNSSSNNFQKFDSYEIMTENIDSVHFFQVKEKSFYNCTLKTYIIWSTSTSNGKFYYN